MDAWPHQTAVLPRLLGGHYALWWEPGVGKTLPLAIAGREVGLPQLWLTLSQGGLLPAQTARTVSMVRGDNPRVQIIRTGKDKVDGLADVVVCSYDLARNRQIWRQLFALSWGSLVLDEAHALAHTASTRTQAVYGARRESKGALWHRAAHVWPASGTPVLNNPMDVWPHVSRLWPAISTDTKQDWEDAYCLVRRTDYGVQIVGGRDLTALRDKLRRHSSSLALADTAPNMPALVSDTVEVEITAEHRRLLEAEMDSLQREQLAVVLAEIENGDEAAEMRLQAMMLPLAGVRRVLAHAKTPAVIAMAAGELDGGLDRVIVFGHHVTALRAVWQGLQKYGAALIAGSTTPMARTHAIADFNSGKQRVLVGNISAMGTGLDLQACRRVLFLEAMWTPSANAQAVARCYRPGQLRPVQVSVLAVERSIDTRVAAVLATKTKIIKGIMGNV